MENNDNSELKLRDEPVKTLEIQKSGDSSELKLRDVPPPLEVRKPEEGSELRLSEQDATPSASTGKDEKVIPLLVARKDGPAAAAVQESEPARKSTGSDDLDMPVPEPVAEKGSVLHTVTQVVIMLVSIAAIIIAGYFIYKQLAPEQTVVPKKEAAKAKQPAPKDQKKTDKPQDQKAAGDAQGQAAKKESKDSKKPAKLDANSASKDEIVKMFLEQKLPDENASGFAEEIIDGRPYKSLDELKNKYKDDKVKQGIIGKTFNSFGSKPKSAPKTDKNAKPDAAKPAETAKPAAAETAKPPEEATKAEPAQAPAAQE